MSIGTMIRNAIIAVVGVLVIWVLAIGLFSSPSSNPYKPEALAPEATDQERATVIANAVNYALQDQLGSLFGFLPNDLVAPWVVDNTVNYQMGVIYATRPASEVMSNDVARYGNRDTIDPRLADATSRFFSYSEKVWGFLFIYDAEGKYKAGIKNWEAWAKSIGTDGKNAGVFNMKSDDVYNIIKYCLVMTDYALGVLNNTDVGHFKTDNNVYYAKGVCAVTANIFRALIAVDSSVIDRGGIENVNEALHRFDMIEEFNPLYVMAGGNQVGDAMLPNHTAALARHIDVANNRIADILSAMAR